MNTNASGILFKTRSEGQVLFLKRGPGGDYPGYWCLPGGRQEDNETLEECAIREAKEEVGTLPPGKRTFLCRSISYDPAMEAAKVQEPGSPAPQEPVEGVGVSPLAPPPSPPVNDEPHGVDFTTFLQPIEDKFEVIKDGEHVGYAWAPPDQPPEPLHPGVRTSLEVLLGDELSIARLMSLDKITSPFTYKNITLFKMRVTGTGYAFRKAKKDDKGKVIREEEFCLRDPTIYLTQYFCDRCAGLPVIFYHPEKKMMLDSEEYKERNVGSVMFAFIQGEEVWCIARIYDDDAIALMTSKEVISTSPAVILSDPEDNPKITLDGGETLLIEGKPSLLDHLAICERGVWDKGQEPAGVIINDSQENQTMPDEKKEEKVVDKKDEDKKEDRKDASEENSKKLDAIMDAVMSMKDRQDAMEKRCDAWDEEKKKDSAKKDSAKKDGGDVGKGEEEGTAKKMAADADKKDSDKEDKKEEKKEEAKADSVDPEVMRRIDQLEKSMPVALTDEDRTKLSEEQSKADDVFGGFGQQAPHPIQGESPTAYRRRCANMLKANSKTWGGVELAKLDGQALDIAVTQIYHDSVSAASAPVANLGKKEIVVERRDRNTGHMVRTFRGSRSFVRQFTMPSRAVTDIGYRRDTN